MLENQHSSRTVASQIPIRRRKFHFERGTVVFFGGLPKAIFKTAIVRYFQDCFGGVVNIKLDESRNGRHKSSLTLAQHRGSGLVEFKSRKVAQYVVSSQHILEGRLFYTRLALPEHAKKAQEQYIMAQYQKIHISGIPKSAAIGKYFSSIQGAKWPRFNSA